MGDLDEVFVIAGLETPAEPRNPDKLVFLGKPTRCYNLFSAATVLGQMSSFLDHVHDGPALGAHVAAIGRRTKGRELQNELSILR